MTIEYLKGDIFESGAQALVNPVNCMGVMGAGLALQFKNKFPENFQLYKDYCKSPGLIPGKVFITKSNKDRYIINFPTKRHWQDESLLDDICLGLITLGKIIKKLEISSIAIPALGCGLGGLAWSDVKPMIEDALEGLDDVNIMVYEP